MSCSGQLKIPTDVGSVVGSDAGSNVRSDVGSVVGSDVGSDAQSDVGMVVGSDHFGHLGISVLMSLDLGLFKNTAV